MSDEEEASGVLMSIGSIGNEKGWPSAVCVVGVVGAVGAVGVVGVVGVVGTAVVTAV